MHNEILHEEILVITWT